MRSIKSFWQRNRINLNFSLIINHSHFIFFILKNCNKSFTIDLNYTTEIFHENVKKYMSILSVLCIDNNCSFVEGMLIKINVIFI